MRDAPKQSSTHPSTVLRTAARSPSNASSRNLACCLDSAAATARRSASRARNRRSSATISACTAARSSVRSAHRRSRSASRSFSPASIRASAAAAASAADGPAAAGTLIFLPLTGTLPGLAGARRTATAGGTRAVALGFFAPAPAALAADVAAAGLDAAFGFTPSAADFLAACTSLALAHPAARASAASFTMASFCSPVSCSWPASCLSDSRTMAAPGDAALPSGRCYFWSSARLPFAALPAIGGHASGGNNPLRPWTSAGAGSPARDQPDARSPQLATPRRPLFRLCARPRRAARLLHAGGRWRRAGDRPAASGAAGGGRGADAVRNPVDAAARRHVRRPVHRAHPPGPGRARVRRRDGATGRGALPARQAAAANAAVRGGGVRVQGAGGADARRRPRLDAHR
eukprot:scaffold2033_cov85-Isochrysis_galbana.AAC.2